MPLSQLSYAVVCGAVVCKVILQPEKKYELNRTFKKMILGVFLVATQPMAVVSGVGCITQTVLIFVCLLISLGIAFGKRIVGNMLRFNRKLLNLNRKYHVISFENDYNSSFDDDED